MKVLKYIGGFILILIIAILLLGLVMKKEYSVVRSIEIDAPKQVVWKNIYSFKAQDKWSPWRELDPNQKTEYIGEDGEVGSGTKWEGDPETVGTGSQELLATQKFERVESKLRFIIPWEAENDVFIAQEPIANGIKVSWGFKGEIGYPMNVFLPFMGMEKFIGQDFEKGLAKLKSICESQTSLGTYGDYEVKYVELPIRYYITKRDTVSWEGIQMFFANNFGIMAKAMAEQGIEMSGMPSSLIYVWDFENQQADMAAAMPISSNSNVLEGYMVTELPSSMAMVVEYMGDYEGSGDAHMMMEKCAEDWGFEIIEPVSEEYVTDPGEEPDTSKWITKITYPVK